MPITRRDLLKLSALAVAALAPAGANAVVAEPHQRTVAPLDILILGGTGFTGPHQVRYALERGHRVTLFNRGRQANEWPGTVEQLSGDRNSGDLAALEGRSWDVCVDNPTTLPFWVRDAGRVLRGKVKQYIFISTVSVYAGYDTPGDESLPLASYQGADAMAETMDSYRARSPLYGPLKALSEQEARKQFGAATTVIRPGLIVGPRDDTDRFTYWPVRLARGGEVLAPGDGRDPVQIIDARDLAEWTLRMAESRTFGTFNATGPERTLTMREMLVAMAAALHADVQLTWVPADFLDAEEVHAWSNMPAWVPGTGDTAGFARHSNGRAVAAGLTFRPLSVTTIDTLAWFRQQPAERQAALKAGLSAEREGQVLADWKAKTRAG